MLSASTSAGDAPQRLDGAAVAGRALGEVEFYRACVVFHCERGAGLPAVARGGKEKEVIIKGKDLGHYAGHRARMGRVLPDKLKPTELRVLPKPTEIS